MYKWNKWKISLKPGSSGKGIKVSTFEELWSNAHPLLWAPCPSGLFQHDETQTKAVLIKKNLCSVFSWSCSILYGNNIWKTCICLGCYYDFNADVTCLQLQLSRRRDEKVRWGNNRTFWNWMRICRPNFYTLIIIGMQTKLIRRTPLISLCRLSNNTITTHVLTFWLKVY